MIKKIRELLAKLPLPFLNDTIPVVTVLPLDGVIGTSSRFSEALNLAGVEKRIEAAFDAFGVKAVALSINSPGGSPVQSELIMRRILKLSEEKKIPVYAFAEDVAASGGYMLALAGEEIYASAASIIGSIGVISAGFGFDKAIEKVGVDRRVYTAGENKSILDPFQPEKEEDVKFLKEIQKDIHGFFKDMVKERRGEKLRGTQKIMFSGKFWTGTEAEKMGLIDGIGDLQTVMKEKFGEKTKFSRIEGEKSFIKSLLGLGGRKSAVSREIMAVLDERAHWGRFGL
ncbi:S49 family peptidase [Emcibacter sp.]|uniref:S49 family peptidase n=1 Tax=Emcibacter sp. TaxID=1979954 RepID=UPI003A8D514D